MTTASAEDIAALVYVGICLVFSFVIAIWGGK